MIRGQLIISEETMLLLVLGRHLMWSRTNADGGTTSYYYYDAFTWLMASIVLLWLTYFFVRRYLRARALRRRPRENRRLLNRVLKSKRELSSRYLRPGFSNTIHAVGIGKVTGDNSYCIQVFVSDANEEWSVGAGATTLPATYRGVPLVLIEMPMAEFLSGTLPDLPMQSQQFPNGIRERQEVILGGLSGANTNLTGESGTIGYFCTRKSKLSRRKEIHLLSNSHVFADLRRSNVDDSDLIMQPSPGEAESNRPIASLVNFSALKFADLDQPNHIDAAIAKLWAPLPHKPLIPLIGAVKGYVRKADIKLGETARKFGRTTGYTEGRVFSIYLDIWIGYHRTGQSAFFQDQFLIEPDLPQFTKFVAKGDSGSLVVDANQNALGLAFGGMAELPESLRESQTAEPNTVIDSTLNNVKRIESYGVANPISEVLERLKIELLV
jgi:hypothetical protein